MTKRPKSEIDWAAYKQKILAGLDLRQEFAALGIIASGEPKKNGWMECYAIERDDNKPSAAVNVQTGQYIDKGGVGLSLSFWDLCVTLKRFARWQDARDHYAAIAGVAIDGRPPRDPAEHLAFLPWAPGLVALWARHKPGVTVEAVQAAGGRVARYRDQYTVVALPIYGPGMLQAEPSGWVLWNSTGRDLPIFSRGRAGGKAETTWKKMKTTGGSDSGLIGRHGLDRLTRPDVDPGRQIVWKVEGPTDLLALWAIIPPEKRENHLVITNAGGATEQPKSWMAQVIAGRRVVVVGDADRSGQAGAEKWARWAAKVAGEVRVIRPAAMGMEVSENHGMDLRDWLAGKTYAELLDLADAAETFQDGPAATADSQQPAAASPSSSATTPSAAGPPEADDDPHRLARINLERYGTRTGGRTLRFWRDEWYVWANNRYRKISPSELRSKITASVKEEFDRLAVVRQAEQDANPKDGDKPVEVKKVTMPIVSGVLQATASMVTLPGTIEPGTWIPTRERRRFVAMANGALDLDQVLADAEPAECVRPNSPEWFSMASLPYAFDPDARCPRFDAFLERNLELDPERIKVVQEWAGYLLVDDTGEQKFMVLEGEGANGKSVYIAALTAMLGEDNVSALPLEIFGDRFARTETLGKSLNTSGDCGELDKVAEGYLKSFTGGDRMFFDRKGVPGINCRPTARLMVACNNRPRFSDRSEGVWRRMLLVPWRIEIPAAERVRGMTKTEWWQESGELPGILNWAIVGLARLRAQGGFTKCGMMEEALNDYREEMNPARVFLLNHLEVSKDGRIRAGNLYKFYAKWARENGYHPLAERTFGKEVRRVFKSVDRKYGGTRIDRFWFYEGISFTQDEICGETTHESLLF